MGQLLLILFLAHKSIELTVTPRVCQAPCDIRLTVRIEPHPDNRAWRWVVDGPMYSASVQQLDGADAPVTQPHQWVKSLSPGDYEIRAEVWGAEKVQGVAVTTVLVQ